MRRNGLCQCIVDQVAIQRTRCKMNGKIVAFFFIVVCCAALQASANIGPQCLLPLERGPCRAHILRYGYNPETHRCEQFVYGGCNANQNNYASIDMCRMYCA